MAAPREEIPQSLEEFVGLVQRLQSASDDPLWYRGCGRLRYKLQPSLYRHRSINGADGFGDLERGLITRFRQRSIPFHSRSLVDDWEALFFMQHYGVPTRLLDWTESPFIAFHFAVMSAPFDVQTNGALTFPERAVLWILNPVVWNRHALGHQSYDGGILSPGDDPLNGYKPGTTFALMNNHPVALYGAHNSPRIVAQRGVFTVSGQSDLPMEETSDNQSFPPEALVKVLLRSSLLPEFRKSILRHGITESVVFPDLEGLAREIRREYGFEV